MSYLTGLFSPLSFSRKSNPRVITITAIMRSWAAKAMWMTTARGTLSKPHSEWTVWFFTSDGANPIGNLQSTTYAWTLTLLCVHSKRCKARQQRAMFPSHSQEAQAPSQHTISLETTILIQGIEKSNQESLGFVFRMGFNLLTWFPVFLLPFLTSHLICLLGCRCIQTHI